MSPWRAAEASLSPCHDKALDLLGRRAHFAGELAAKLERRGFAGGEIETVCRRLADAGLLDDLACARSLAAGPYRRKGYGPLKVRAALARRGAAQEAVDRVVGESFPDGGLEAALDQAGRWLERRPADGARLARHLTAKGYGEATVRAALRRLDLTLRPAAGRS